MARRSKRRATQSRRRAPKKEHKQVTPHQEPEPHPSSLPEDEVAEASMESFPASDPPSWSRRGSETQAEERE